MKIYEVVDATNNETYYPLALYLILDEAISSIENITPDEWNSDGYIDDYTKIEVRERSLGWRSEVGDVVFILEWNKVYNEETDVNEWRMERGVY